MFAKTIGINPDNSDVHYLAESQRDAIRPSILAADAGMTGCNFAVAETGSVVVCTNEGNADLSANVPKLLSEEYTVVDHMLLSPSELEIPLRTAAGRALTTEERALVGPA